MLVLFFNEEKIHITKCFQREKDINQMFSKRKGRIIFLLMSYYTLRKHCHNHKRTNVHSIKNGFGFSPIYIKQDSLMLEGEINKILKL